MGKLELVVLVGFLLACFALITAPVVVAQEDDNTPPSAPASVASSVSAGSSVTTSQTITTTSITIIGTAETNATVKVYVSTDNGATWPEQTAARTTVDSSGNWSTTVSVTEGVITGIKVSVVDAAGNESSATLLGYVMQDASSPTVTITSPEGGTTTTDTSITVTGTVTKDAWESWSDLTLTIQVGTNAVTVPLTGTTFSTSVDLSEGTNTIITTVTDGVNVPVSTSITVTRATAQQPTTQQPTTPAPAVVTIEHISVQVGQVISIGENGIASVTVVSAQAAVVNFEAAQPVTAISVTTNTAMENISVQVQQLAQKPTEVSEPTAAVPGVVVSHYFEITITPIAATSVQVENAIIEFKVSKLWLTTNNIAPDSVTLLKYEGGQWIELPTAATREDATYKYYAATTAGSSTFSVVGKVASSNLTQTLIVLAGVIATAFVITIIYWNFKHRAVG